jgi:hypothetical protein
LDRGSVAEYYPPQVRAVSERDAAVVQYTSTWRLGNLTTPKRVQKLQTALHAKAKAEAGYRFYALYDKISRDDILAHAYAQCRSNKSLPLRRQGACRESMARILRTSRHMGSSGGWLNRRLRSGRRPAGRSR